MTAPAWVVPLSDVVGDEELVDAVADAVRSGWWSTGPRVEAFEEQLTELTGSRHAIALANGTAALHLGLLAVGAGPGDEVITPSLTFVAAVNTIRHTGATPVFCDVLGDHDLNLDPADVEAAITPRTKAIVVLHYAGFPCAIDDVVEIAERHGVTVIEDAAHAIGATHGGRSCGTFGALGCFSFFSNKNVPIGEGGAIVTDEDDLAARVRLLRSHGMTTLTWDRHRGHASAYDVVAVGFNYRFDEMRAAMGAVQLRRLPGGNEVRRGLADRYVELLHERHGLTVPFAGRPDRAEAAHHLVVTLLPAGVDRDDVRAALAAEGVQTSVHYPPAHRFSTYAHADMRPLPRTDAVADRLLTVPLFPGLTDDQLELVATTLTRAVASAQIPLKSGIDSADEEEMAPTGRSTGTPRSDETRP